VIEIIPKGKRTEADCVGRAAKGPKASAGPATVRLQGRRSKIPTIIPRREEFIPRAKNLSRFRRNLHRNGEPHRLRE